MSMFEFCCYCLRHNKEYVDKNPIRFTIINGYKYCHICVKKSRKRYKKKVKKRKVN